MKVRLLYNSNQISPEYTINIKNYICRFEPRIINASSFNYIAKSFDNKRNFIIKLLPGSYKCFGNSLGKGRLS